MPKLLVFAPCEKIIISQDENNPTLVAILTGVSLQADADELRQAIGDDSNQLALAPLRWAAFSLWLREESDKVKEFTQTIDIESPAGKVILSHRNGFAFAQEANTHRVNIQFPGFPVREHGVYKIRLSLDGNPVAEFPIELKLHDVRGSQT